MSSQKRYKSFSFPNDRVNRALATLYGSHCHQFRLTKTYYSSTALGAGLKSWLHDHFLWLASDWEEDYVFSGSEGDFTVQLVVKSRQVVSARVVGKNETGPVKFWLEETKRDHPKLPISFINSKADV